MAPRKVVVERGKQKTLAAFQFTKSVVHRNKNTEVEIPEEIECKETYFQCRHCKEFFLSKQGLAVHILCKHEQKEVTKDNNNNIEETSCCSIESFVKESLLEKILEKVFNVEVVEDPDEEPATKVAARGRHGAQKRRQYTASFKLGVIERVENSDLTELDLEEKYKVNRSLINKWKNTKNKIIAAALSDCKNMLKIRPAVKHNVLHNNLLKVFRVARRKGHRVNFSWLLSHARRLHKEATGNPQAVIGIYNSKQQKNI